MYMLSFRKGFKDGIPIFLGYLSVAFAFGMLAVEKGLPLWSPLLLSLSNFTGTGQFAGIDLLSSHAGFLEVAFALIVINIRYVLMSFSLSQKLDPKLTTVQRMLIAFGNTDEIFGVSMQQKEVLSGSYMAGIILCSFAGWNIGTVLGVFSSSALPEIIRIALGIALYAMFIAIITPPARESSAIFKIILISVTLSALIYFVPAFSEMGSGWRIVICGTISAGLGAYFYPQDIAVYKEDVT